MNDILFYEQLEGLIKTHEKDVMTLGPRAYFRLYSQQIPKLIRLVETVARQRDEAYDIICAERVEIK